MGQALYRKYRSKALSEIVGQTHITTTLERAIKDGKLAHAYLFTGPRGSGKTSIARILAHMINDLEYVDESMHLDIIEIDAASNRRIDEIRELRDKVHVAPTSAKYKVYIIDEVHMLTKEAFNALLKTLEEPPAHAVFILATTELHKVPDTIISRTQRFAFKPVETDKVVAHLRYIADQEDIDIDDQALELIAQHGEGGMRDSISLLDQMRNSPEKPVTADIVRLLLGVPEAAATEALLAEIKSGNQAAVLKQVQQLLEQGFGATQIAAQLYDLAKQQLLAGATDSAALLELMQQLLTVSAAHIPEIKLELVVLQATIPNQTATPAVPAMPSVAAAPAQTFQASAPVTHAETVRTKAPAAMSTDVPPRADASPVPTLSIKPQTDNTKNSEPDNPESDSANTDNSAKQPAKAEATPPKAANTGAPLDSALWQRVLLDAKNHNNTLYGVLRMGHPTFDGSKVTLAFAYPFHQKRLNESKNKSFVANSLFTLSGQQVSVEVIVDKSVGAQPPEFSGTPADMAPPPTTPPPDMMPASSSQAPQATPGSADPAKSIMDVFGGGEVL